jgi:hypothetical protein
MPYLDLPAYVRRDLKRMHGNILDAGALSVVDMLGNLDSIVTKQGAAGRVDAWMLRHVTRERSIHRALGIVLEARPTMTGSYHRKGDFCLIQKKAS